MPRVVVLAPLPPPATGQSVVTETVVEALRDVAEVHVVNAAERVPAWRRPGTLPLGRARAWAGHLAAFRAAMEPRPDAVYLTPASSLAGLVRDAAALAAVPAGVRVVGHVHTSTYGALLAHAAAGPLARRVAARFARLVVPSEFAAAGIRRAVPGLPVEVVPNPVARVLRVDPADEADARAVRRDAREIGGRPHVLSVSNGLPEKGQDTLAGALAILARRGVAVRATFAGGWPTDAARAAFEAHLAALGLAEARVVGAVPHAETRALYASADVLAFPSRLPESFGMAVLEAMAAGCAVVATGHAGAAEIVRDGVDGRLVPPGDAAALAGALADALEHADRYGAAAAERARTAFAAAPLAARIAALVLGLAWAPREEPALALA